jgi:methanogen homocitrate synthase
MNDKHFRENEWWVSPYNYAPEVRNTYDLPARVASTTRRCATANRRPASSLSASRTKSRSPKSWTRVGVDRIEAGMPAVSEQDFGPSGNLRLGLKAKIYTFAPGHERQTSTRRSNAGVTA